MEKAPEAPTTSKLLDKAFESTFGLIMAFVITTALIGGLEYLQTGYETDLLNIDQERETYRRQYEEYLANGVLFEKADAPLPIDQRIIEIHKALSDTVMIDRINGEFVTAASAWCQDTIRSLLQQRARQAILVVNDDLYKRLQTINVQQYDLLIEQLSLLSNAVQTWNNKTPDQRKEFLQSFAGKGEELNNNEYSYVVLSDQLLGQDDRHHQEFLRRSTATIDKLGMVQKQISNAGTRILVAEIVLGVLFALLILRVYKEMRKR
jgi:hypothetical protein